MSELLEVSAIVVPKISLALFQNSVPVLSSLELTNLSDRALQDLVVKMTTSPSFTETKTWHVQSIEPGGKAALSQLLVAMDAGRLDALDEAQRSVIRFEVVHGDETLATQDYEVELLPKNHWGGISAVPEILAAFVQPNDSAIDASLSRAADILRQNRREPGIAGYSSEAPRKRAHELASAIWSAVGGLSINYVVPPSSFENWGQKVRSPSWVASNRLATCLDSTLFLAACLEQARLNPIVIVIQGHAFCGVWLAPETFTTSIVDDVTAIRKRIALKELIVFETTALTHRPVPKFSEACRLGLAHLTEDKDHQFEFALDIHRARMERIKPLAKFEQIALEPDNSATTAEPDLEEAPDLPEGLPDESTKIEETPQGRVDHWQRKLLDLSLRNSLLNFRAARAIRIDAPKAGKLEDVLATGKELKLLKRPDLVAGSGVAKEIHSQRHGEDAQAAYALEALDRGELLVDLPQEKLDTQLTELYRTARATFQEGGANTLFLALGFLSWKRDNKDDRKFRAPLILIPVSLERKSVRSGFRLKLHDDEPRFNQTLLEMLRQDFNLTIEGLSGELPKDDSGIDLDLIWRRVESAIKDIQGWEVAREVVLSTFSFAKYLMWKDLVDRTEILKKSPVVRHLIDTPRDKFPADRDFILREQLDYIKHPTETYCPLPADSSQLAAVMSAATGKDFVLIGPPGTGKSQTIANGISQCLAEGKKVLFVSAKTAALDVVHRRLAQMGLGDFCLEVHSAKANKAEVLAQLGRSLSAKGGFDSAQWEREGKRLKDLREKLNVFVGRIHKMHSNGLTLFRAMGTGLKAPANMNFSWPDAGQHDREALDRLRDIAGSLDANGAEVGEVKENPLQWIRTSSWSPAWKGEVETAAKALAKSSLALPAAAKRLCDSTGMPTPELVGRARQGVSLLAAALPQAAGRDWRFVLRPDAVQLVQKLQKAAALLSERQAAKRELTIEYKDEALRLNHASLEQAWELAGTKWWLAKMLGRSKVKKELLSCASDPKAGKSIDCLNDLAKLKLMRAKDVDLEPFADLEAKTNGVWAGLKTDLDEVKSATEFQAALSRAIGMLAANADTLGTIMSAVSRLLGDANALLV